MSTCSYELHLEPNQIPYIVSANGSTDVANAPLLGTQISTLIFPLIPNAVKMELPNKEEIEFLHTHNLGNFNFQVRKSPAGFNVTIRPIISEANAGDAGIELLPVEPISTFSNSINQETISPTAETRLFPIESSSFVYENETSAAQPIYRAPELENEESFSQPTENVSLPPVETIPFNDPAFQTVFSDTSTYEPPGRRDDYNFQTEEFAAPQDDFSSQTDTFIEQPAQFQQPQQQFQPQPQYQQPQFAQQPVQQFYAPQMPQEAAFVPARANSMAQGRMDALFQQMAQVGASDLHMSVSMPPMIRKDGKMQQLQCNEGVLAPEAMKELLTSIMPAKNQEEFSKRNDTDFAYEIANLARFRANIFADRKGMGGVFRIIPTKILTAEQLGLSQAIMNLCDLSKGLVVVTGPTGSGKSTTLCAMIDHINKKREDHIITIEDPIEFTHENQRCLVNQREVHNHTDSFKDALRAALREDPDILLVGEMRDLETVSIAIETAETGHLVFGTLHTTTACSTVDRIIDQFPADRQQQIRVMLSESLKGVISQTLLPKKGGGRVAALEILIVTPAISNLIREGKTFQIPSAMQTGKQLGMTVLNDALMNLVMKGLVEPRDAYIKAVDKPGFEGLMQRNNIRI
ncbi:MAG: type IV pilus twitching motility protein PilT [Pyrinomonadaceae bacterium]